MPKLHHDPKTKKMIKDVLYTHLYGPTLKAFKLRLDTLIIKNALLAGASHQSFIYKGQLYTCDSAPSPRRSQRLLPALVPAMEEYLTDIKQLNSHELPYVLGFINQVLNSSNELHDYLRALPEAMHYPILDLINTCPCRGKGMTEDAMSQLKDDNNEAISLLKQRLVFNLIS